MQVVPIEILELLPEPMPHHPELIEDWHGEVAHMMDFVRPTLEGTYAAGRRYYRNHLIQLIRDFIKLIWLRQRLTMNRAIELFFAPVYEKNSLLNDLDFAQNHGGTEAQQALWHEAVRFIRIHRDIAIGISDESTARDALKEGVGQLLTILEKVRTAQARLEILGPLQTVRDIVAAAKFIRGKKSFVEILQDPKLGVDVFLYTVYNYVFPKDVLIGRAVVTRGA